jgi:hypothetical protein
MNKVFIFILVLIMSACSVEETTTYEPTTSGTSDGTASAPAELTVGTAKSGGIATNGDSYYQFTTSATGAGSYKLAIESMVVTDGWSSYAVTTSLYSTAGMTSSSRLDWESCAASCALYFDYQNLDASKTYYLKLAGFGTVTYSLTVSQSGSEGSVNNPVELTLGTAHSGTIDNIDGTWENGYSYYKFTTASADNYTLTMTNSDSLDCTLYSNSAFSTVVSYYNYNNCTAGTNLSDNFTGTSSSAGLSASTAYYLRIEGTLTTVKTTTYNITVAAEGN